MKAWLISLWMRIPLKVRVALAAVGSMVAACFALFFLGKREGRQEGQVVGAAGERVREMEDAGARGDDAAVDRAIKDSVRRGRKR